MGRRIEAHTSQNKFALQLYSRLTNANPELVLVFMQAGGSGPSKSVPIHFCFGRLCKTVVNQPHFSYRMSRKETMTTKALGFVLWDQISGHRQVVPAAVLALEQHQLRDLPAERLHQ